MKVIEVIPIARGIAAESLTYFTTTDPDIGSLVSVEIRGRKVKGLVVAVHEATEQKAELRNSAFSIKKAEAASQGAFFTPAFFEAVRDITEYYAGSTGGTLHNVIPSAVLEQLSDLKSVADSPHTARTPSVASKHTLVYQADDRERVAEYKSIVRESFARNQSVFICVPTAIDATRLEEELERGIKNYVYVFHSQLKKKELATQWNEVVTEKHPVLIIATGTFFCIPRRDIGTIIVERENSRGYKIQIRPFVDIRLFAESYAYHSGARFILADLLPRTETIYRYRQEDIAEYAPLTFRASTTANQRTIDNRRENGGKDVPFEVVSKELQGMLRAAVSNNEQTFVYASRRGLAPLTVCADCGSVVTCKRCHVPIVLHATSTERFFLCHHCGERRSAEEKCSHCTSWRLQTLGVGIELVAEELRKKLPGAHIFRIDSDTVTSNTKARAIIKKFYEQPGSILLGTEMALSYLSTPLENTVVASIDPLFGVPDFRINEKILATLLKIRSLATKQFIIQTRNPSQRLFQYALAGNVSDFYKEELEERQRFDYPPFAVMIKITLVGPSEKIEHRMEELRDHFADYAFDVYRTFSPRGRLPKGHVVEHMLIKIGAKRWIDNNLLALVHELPPDVVVEIEPDSVL